MQMHEFPFLNRANGEFLTQSYHNNVKDIFLYIYTEIYMCIYLYLYPYIIYISIYIYLNDYDTVNGIELIILKGIYKAYHFLYHFFERIECNFCFIIYFQEVCAFDEFHLISPSDLSMKSFHFEREEITFLHADRWILVQFLI